jgi:methylphosphotriester-DNA--protein-cysteine methyltransferase
MKRCRYFSVILRVAIFIIIATSIVFSIHHLYLQKVYASSRHFQFSEREVVYVGSAKSNKYHYPSCRWAKKIKSSNLVTFSSVSDARRCGYVPCKVCRPPTKD